MFLASDLILKIVLLVMVISSGNHQATQLVNEDNKIHNDQYDDRKYEDLKLFPEKIFKKERLRFDDSGFIEKDVQEDHGLSDGDQHIIKDDVGQYNRIEAQFIITYKLRNLDIDTEKSRKSVATNEMLERITIIQGMLVRIRDKMILNLLGRARELVNEIEYTFPVQHICAVQVYNELIRLDWPARYPFGLLKLVKNTKEVLLKSKLDDTPIALISEAVYRRLEFVLNQLGSRLKEHGTFVYRILETLVVEQKRRVRDTCKIPRRAEPITFSFLEDQNGK